MDLNQRMFWAVEHNQIEVLRLTLELGADVHAQDDRALRWAAENGQADCVKLIKQYMHKTV